MELFGGSKRLKRSYSSGLKSLVGRTISGINCRIFGADKNRVVV